MNSIKAITLFTPEFLARIKKKIKFPYFSLLGSVNCKCIFNVVTEIDFYASF